MPLPKNTAKACREWRVSGQVQGVWFRGAAREQANALGIKGIARNLDDGSVQVIAMGDEESLQQLQKWLHDGPQRARVDRVLTVEPPSTAGPFDSFEIA